MKSCFRVSYLFNVVEKKTNFKVEQTLQTSCVNFEGEGGKGTLKEIILACAAMLGAIVVFPAAGPIMFGQLI